MRAIASLVLLAALCVASPALSQTAPGPFGDVAHHGVRVDGIRFHYVTAGSGEPVVLLPGWPEMSWIAWRKVIPLLVKAGRQVYVLEPRGFGDSDKPQGGYDLDTAARDLHGFLAAAGINRPGGVDIVAHDVGTWIAHAHAAVYPDDVRRLVLTESNLPGVSPPATCMASWPRPGSIARAGSTSSRTMSAPGSAMPMRRCTRVTSSGWC